MRDKTCWSVLLIGLAGLGSAAWGQVSQNCGNQICPERRTISAPGTAQVMADADLAIVRVGYKIYGPDAKTTYQRAAEISNAIMNALTASGIPKTAVESTSQVLQHTQIYDLQQFPMGSEDREHRQFTASQNWIIRVKPDQAGTALNTAVNAGANESGWIQWAVDDPSSLQARAAAEAVAHARKTAEEIAARSGVRLGHLVSVSENQGPMNYNGVSYASIGANTFGIGDGLAFAGVMPGQNQQLAVNSQRLQFRATVFAVFAIEDEEKTGK